MNRDDLFKLVKDWADEVTDGNGYVTYEFDPPALVRFVECVIEEEREACAALCDKISDEDGFEGGYADRCAFAIRERGAP